MAKIRNDTEEEAIDCLNSHPIIFNIEKLESNIDCWGRNDCDWKTTNIYFKKYEDAIKYTKIYDKTRVAYKELN